MRASRGETTTLLFAASALLAARFLVALALIPPWQQPDEATHVAHIELQRSRAAGLDTEPDPAREAEILQSMADHHWWEHRRVGLRTPIIAPDKFSYFGAAGTGISAVVEVLLVSDPPAFYVVTGRLFNWLPRFTVVQDLYLLRVMSALLGLLTLWVAWLGARESLGARAGTIVAVLLALHPQFAIVSTAASPDPVPIFLGACIWWQTAVAIRRERFAVPLAVIWAAAVAAASTDRVGVPLVAVALLVSGIASVQRVPLSRRWAALALPAVAGCALAVGLAIWVLDAFGSTYGFNYIFSRGWAPVPGAMTWERFARFNWALHQTWWYVLGWGRYTTPGWWVAVVTAITLAAGAGLARMAIRHRFMDSQTRTLLLVAAAGIAIQLAAIYWSFFRLGIGAQGRYLFPFLAPSLVLLWSGIDAWAPQRLSAVAAALVLILALLDAAAWILVAIPAYYASL